MNVFIKEHDVEVAWMRPEGPTNHGNINSASTQISQLLSMCEFVVCVSSNVILYSAALKPRIRVARHLALARGY